MKKIFCTMVATLFVIYVTAQTENNAQEKTLLTSGTTEVGFYPAANLTPSEIEKKVNAKNPYTLYRKGSVAEYAFEYKGKPFKLYGGPSSMQQIVYDEKIENGLLISYLKQAFLNKKGQPAIHS